MRAHLFLLRRRTQFAKIKRAGTRQLRPSKGALYSADMRPFTTPNFAANSKAGKEEAGACSYRRFANKLQNTKYLPRTAASASRRSTARSKPRASARATYSRPAHSCSRPAHSCSRSRGLRELSMKDLRSRTRDLFDSGRATCLKTCACQRADVITSKRFICALQSIQPSDHTRNSRTHPVKGRPWSM